MSRRNRGSKRSSGASVVGDAARDGSGVPIPQQPGSGGSALSGLLVEGNFIQAPRPKFVDSFFGERYVGERARPVYLEDIGARLVVYTTSFKGYQVANSSTGIAAIPGIDDGYKLLADWYPLVRDMGKRNLKYKHLPLTLATYPDMLLNIFDVYYWTLAWLTTLCNLNRLPQYSLAFAVLTPNLSRYMSRVIRGYRRLSAIPMAGFVKAHGLRSGMIVAGSDLAPVVRVHSPALFKANLGAASPSITLDVSTNAYSVFTDADRLGELIASIENAIRWLEIGNATIATDFTAVKDLIDMTIDIVPGTFAPGLPASDTLPGIVMEPSLISDYMYRAATMKLTVTGADKWIGFPCFAHAKFQNRVPIMGLGPLTMYDDTLLGTPKFTRFDSGSTIIGDAVDCAVLIPGTDFRQRAMDFMAVTTVNAVVGDLFGASSKYKEYVVNMKTGVIEGMDEPFNWNDAGPTRIFIKTDSLSAKCRWGAPTMCSYVSGDLAGSNFERHLVESGFERIHWIDPIDLGPHYALFLAQQLGIPYIK